MLRTIVALIAAVLLSATALAGTLEEALDALGDRDYATALQLLRPLAEGGDAQAQYHLSTIYEYGYGVEPDDKLSVYWLQKAAEQREPRARYDLSNRYEQGRGVPQDAQQALQWRAAAPKPSEAVQSATPQERKFTGTFTAASEILSFVQRYQGKYPSEIGDRRGFEREFVARTAIWAPTPVDLTYDDATGLASLRLSFSESRLFMLDLVQLCRTTGKAMGVNAFGVRMPFTRQTCHEVFIRGHENVSLGDHGKDMWKGSTVSVTVTPDEFRRLKGLGHLDIAVAFTPLVPSKGEVVKKETRVSQAELDQPFETTRHVYYVDAVVRELWYFLPWSKTPFATQQVE